MVGTPMYGLYGRLTLTSLNRWGHVIGGKQGANDPDHPIAASHKGRMRFMITLSVM